MAGATLSAEPREIRLVATSNQEPRNASCPDHRKTGVMQRLAALLDPFVIALLATVALASVLPARGAAVVWVDLAAQAGIVLLF